MTGSRGLAIASLIAATACHPAVSSDPPGDDRRSSDTEPSPLEPETPTNREAGDQLAAIVPLLDGGTLELASLRGRVVLLEISASNEPGWRQAHAEHAELARNYGERLQIVVVANDGDPSALEGEVMGPFELGWDPQGALAARLQVAGFPTFLLLDTEGEIAWIHRGFDDETLAELRAQIGSLLAR